MELVLPRGECLPLSGMEGDAEFGEDVGPGDRVRLWLPLDFVGWIVRECGYSGMVRTGVEVREAPGDTRTTEFEVDIDRCAPPTPPAVSHGRFREGDY
jgi:hypothetical protein